MGAGSSIVSTPLIEQHLTITLQTPNVIALMDASGPGGSVYELINQWPPGIEGAEDVFYVNAFRVNERPFAVCFLATIFTGLLFSVTSSESKQESYCCGW
jgi:hypothetical protein